MCSGTRGCVKSGVFRTQSSSLNIIGELMLISVSCGGQTSFVQILISLPAGISLSFSRDHQIFQFFLFVLFFCSVDPNNAPTKKKYSKSACVTCVQFSPFKILYIFARHTSPKSIQKHATRKETDTSVYNRTAIIGNLTSKRETNMGGGGASFSDQEEKDQEAKKEGFGKTEEEEKEEMTSLRRSSVPHELESALIGEGGQMSKNENNDSSSSEEGGRVVVKSKKIGDSRYFPSLENDEDEEESADDTKNENNNTTNNNNNKGEGEGKTYEEGEIRQTRTEEDDLKSEEASMNEKVRRLSVRVSNNEDETTTTMKKKNNNNNNQDIDENDVNLPRDLMSAAI